MFGERCLGLASCGHNVNWTCPCTCDEAIELLPAIVLATPPKISEADRLRAQIEGMAMFVQHDAGCDANDLDYLDTTACTCGLRRFYNPKGQPSGSDGEAGK